LESYLNPRSANFGADIYLTGDLLLHAISVSDEKH